VFSFSLPRDLPRSREPILRLDQPSSSRGFSSNIIFKKFFFSFLFSVTITQSFPAARGTCEPTVAEEDSPRFGPDWVQPDSRHSRVSDVDCWTMPHDRFLFSPIFLESERDRDKWEIARIYQSCANSCQMILRENRNHKVINMKLHTNNFSLKILNVKNLIWFSVCESRCLKLNLLLHVGTTNCFCELFLSDTMNCFCELFLSNTLRINKFQDIILIIFFSCFHSRLSLSLSLSWLNRESSITWIWISYQIVIRHWYHSPIRRERNARNANNRSVVYPSLSFSFSRFTNDRVRTCVWSIFYIKVIATGEI